MRMIRRRKRVSPRFSGLEQFGWTEGRQTCGSTFVGAQAMPTAFAKTRRNWPPSRRTSFWQTAAPAVAALQLAARTVPIVFVAVIDPVGAVFVETMARPGGNATGFTNYEYGMSGKWLELLKELAPRSSRVGVIRDPSIAAGGGQLGALQAVAPPLGVELSPIGVRDAGEIERGIAAFARGTNDGLIVTGSTLATLNRELIVTLAARLKLPAVYSLRFFVTGGGLISFGPDRVDQYRRAAGYVARILNGERPADVPVQAPVKYEIAINSKPRKRSASKCRRRCSPAPTR